MENVSSLRNTFPEGNWTEEEKQQRLEQLSYDTFHTLLPTIFFVVVLLFIGLPGNLLVFFVYLKQFPPSATRVFILALAVCDLTINVFCLPRHIIMMRYSYRSQGLAYCRLVVPIAVFPILMSYWLLVCVALDRRDRICNPLRRHLNPRQATYLLLVPFTLTALAIFPYIHLQEERPFDIGIPGLQGIQCTFSPNHTGINVAKAYGITLTSSYGVILTFLVISYVNIVFAVLRHSYQLRRYAASRPFTQQTLPHSSTADSTPANTRGQANLTTSSAVMYTVPGTAAIAAEASKEETTPCDAEKNAKAGVLDEPEPIEDPGGKENTNGQPPCPVSNNNDNSSSQVHDQQSPTFVVTAAEYSSSNSSSLDIDKFGEEQGAASLAPPGQDQSASTWTEDGSSAQRRFISARPEQPVKAKKKKGFSKTTLMMLVLTGATVIFCVPYFYVELSRYQYVGQGLNDFTINIRFLARVFPSVNSVMNPFIYSFINPRFRKESARFLTKPKTFCF